MRIAREWARVTIAAQSASAHVRRLRLPGGLAIAALLLAGCLPLTAAQAQAPASPESTPGLSSASGGASPSGSEAVRAPESAPAALGTVPGARESARSLKASHHSLPTPPSSAPTAGQQPNSAPVIRTHTDLGQGPESAVEAQNQPLIQPQDQPVPYPATSAATDQTDPVQAQLRQSQQNLARAESTTRRTLVAGAVCLVILILIAIAVIVWLSFRAREWNKRSEETLEQAKAVVAQLTPLRDAQEEIRRTLPELLEEVGEQPLNFQEEGTRFPPQALVVLDDIDHLAYLGSARLSFSSLSRADAAVYLNGLLLSAVAQLARRDPWAAMARLDRFLDLLGRHGDAVDAHRAAQAYSYRALAAYQVLEVQDSEPSWLRKPARQRTESLAKQAFGDVAEASRLSPEWRHSAFVEALLCSRFYSSEEGGESSRAELYIRGLRRAISLYKQLIEDKSYRGPARHNLARCYKRIAEQTGEKSDFSDFGYALSSFPTDEELSDEALAARQPDSRDRFLWQWMLADAELFRSAERLNMAEYRSFWIRLLDNKVHLRNWRADLGELHRRDPAMGEWGVQLLYIESPISLANPISRRPERFETPSSGA